MVAELLGLKLRVLANSFRGPLRQVIPRAAAFAVAVLIPILAVQWLQMLRDRGDDSFTWGAVVLGALVPILCLLIPVLVTRRDPLHPRAFVLFGYRPTAVAALLTVFGILSLPVLVLAVYLAGFVLVWGSDGRSTAPALAAALGMFLLSYALILIGRAVGVSAARSRWATTVRFAAAALLVAVGIRVLPAFVGDPRYFYGRFADLGSSLESTFVAWLPLHPRRAAAGEAVPDAQLLLGCLVLALLLWLAWRLWVGHTMSARSGGARRRRPVGVGWFAALPSTPTGAVAARSLTYWLRDPRYAATFPLLPLIPVLMLAATWVGGVPFSYAVLIPLPAMVAVLAWATMHNDVAYDSTAVWSHIVADIRGAHDRVGRTIPALLAGILLIAVGAPLTAWGFGSFEVLPIVIGVSGALLLGALGISSGVSARFPYPAPRPGDSAFSAPQASVGSAGRTQAYTFLGVLLVAVPSLVAAGLWLVERGSWGWISLGAGLGVGLIVLVIGVWLGGRAFERRAPDLLAFTVRN